MTKPVKPNHITVTWETVPNPDPYVLLNSPWWKWRFSSGAHSFVWQGWQPECAPRSGPLTSRSLRDTLQEHPDQPEAEKEAVPAVLQAPRRARADFPAQYQAQVERCHVNQEPL